MDLSSQHGQCSHVRMKHRDMLLQFTLPAEIGNSTGCELEPGASPLAPLLPALHMFFSAKTPSQTFHCVLKSLYTYLGEAN